MRKIIFHINSLEQGGLSGLLPIWPTSLRLRVTRSISLRNGMRKMNFVLIRVLQEFMWA